MLQFGFSEYKSRTFEVKLMTESSRNHKQTNPLHAMRAVLWSFFGVRSKSEYQADINRLTMTQIIVAGIVGAILFVMTLLLLVYFVTR
jgi:Protein of unknown function (DUF2970)